MTVRAEAWGHSRWEAWQAVSWGLPSGAWVAEAVAEACGVAAGRAGVGTAMAGGKLPSSTSFASLCILLPDDHCHRVVRSSKGYQLSEGQGAPARSGQRSCGMKVWESIGVTGVILQERGAPRGCRASYDSGGLEGNQTRKQSLAEEGRVLSTSSGCYSTPWGESQPRLEAGATRWGGCRQILRLPDKGTRRKAGLCPSPPWGPCKAPPKRAQLSWSQGD